ncbi:hypothetical protein AX15_006962 [Amanita polypyramis BW_CC]|nr:hypothetical protein AX15_006962 [Amanita polypyramis BW_CC]
MVGTVPFGFNTLDISGRFILNAALSDDTDKILQLQGIGWLARKVIGLASVTLEIKHYKDDKGIEHIDIDEYTTTGRIATTAEHRAFLWQEAEFEDRIFGSMLVKARRCKAEDLNEEFLAKGWTVETYQHGLVQSHIESNPRRSRIIWSANEAWGVEEINGENRFTRRVYFTGPQKQVVEARLVYNYCKPMQICVDLCL